MNRSYKLYNNVLGWITFAIAAVTYLMTIEPTASFWDCGEFISSAYKLEVGHPPGNPFFALMGRFFANFASDPSQVAMMINSMSALFSALTILFLFWSITRLARKVVCKDEQNISTKEMISILGSGLVGALVYTFSDTFWFSAVEGEVYAFSSLLTAVVFWMILKWEDVADDPRSDRWIILISYVMGLSIGVHLLNLLCIPAIVLVYYFKKNPQASLKQTAWTLLGSFVLIAALMYGIIPGVVKVAGQFELFFVNTIGLTFNSGLYIYLIVLLGSLGWAIYETISAANKIRMNISVLLALTLMGAPFYGDGLTAFFIGLIILAGLAVYLFKFSKLTAKTLNTTMLCAMVIFVGYSTFALILIRSSANPPMDQNAPDNIFTLERYLNREQYGDRPLFYGETFVSEVKRDANGTAMATQIAPNWVPAIKKSEGEKDKYFIVDYKTKYQYEDETKMLFPRMYSSEPQHVAAYKDWSDFKGKSVRVNRNGEQKTVIMPTFAENVKYFFSYQLNYMYWRYFMWNFVGRQNDIQGSGGVQNGNWVSGISFIDEWLVGNQELIPDDLKNNKGHNTYFFLPLLLGIIGLIYQAYKGEKGIQGFWITFFLFFMTGIAIVIYLNQYPGQPRERDYAYAGSFYAFAIWVGLGVAGIADKLSKYIKGSGGAVLAVLLTLPIPVLMAQQNWDDHDRSDRYTARDFAYNYLSSCAPNAVIFTYGDNDTFPLWYAQEVEGYRTDVRVCNLSYLQADWYIKQMQLGAYESKPLPISMTQDKYIQGKRDVVYVMDFINEPIPLKDGLEMALSDDPKYKKIPNYPGTFDFIPAQTAYLPFELQDVLKKGYKVPYGVSPDSINTRVEIPLGTKGRGYIMKAELAMLDMIQNNNWDRPIYFAISLPDDSYLNLIQYMSLEGMAYRLTPFYSENEAIDTEVMYDNMMNKFKWGNMDKKDIYLDETTLRMCKTFRLMFAQLADRLMEEGKTEKASKAIDRCLEVLPGKLIPHDFQSLSIAETYYKLGKKKQGDELLEKIMMYFNQRLKWYETMKGGDLRSVLRDYNYFLQAMQTSLQISDSVKSDLTDKYLKEFVQHMAFWDSISKR